MIKNIIIRALSGAVYVALIVASILLLDKSAVTYLVLFSVFTVLGVKEVYDMSRHEENPSWLVTLIDMLGGVGLAAMLPDLLGLQGAAAWGARLAVLLAGG